MLPNSFLFAYEDQAWMIWNDLSVSEIEDAIQSGNDKGSVSLIASLAQLVIDGKLTLEQAKGQIEEKNIEILNRTIMQLRIKSGKNNPMYNNINH